MDRTFRSSIGIFLLICVAGSAQNRPPIVETLGIPANPQTGSTIQYGNGQWEVVKHIRAIFDPGAVPSTVVLLRSLRPTSTDGGGAPISAAELVILQDGEVVYDYVRDGV